MVMNFYNKLFLCAIAIIAVSVSTGCSSEEQLGMYSIEDVTTPLSINVSNTFETGMDGVITKSQFSDGSSLGLFLTMEDGNSAYDTPYNNIKYISSTSGGNQVWTATPNPILLTGTKANVYAYYPYDANYKDITKIPIDVTEDKDVMWADYASDIYNANPSATLSMNHALSVIRLSLSKGDYSGAGSIESIKIQGECMAKTGTLNAQTGDVTVIEGGTKIDLGITAENPVTLTTAPKTLDQYVIPASTSGPIKVTVKMDGITFETISSTSFAPERSKIYKFGLAFKDSKLLMSTVSIDEIAEVSMGDVFPFTTANDGVYGIDADGKLLTYDDASKAVTLRGVAIMICGRTLQIANVGSSSVFGLTTIDVAGLYNYNTADGTNISGYLNGSGTSKLSQDYTTWFSTNGALSDFNGKKNTEIIIEAIGGTTENTIAKATVDFRAGASNQGYDDWFIPSCGELAYMYLKVSEINALLAKCGGTSLTFLSESSEYADVYWSSSEYNAFNMWGIDFNGGYVLGQNQKANNVLYQLRFCREL